MFQEIIGYLAAILTTVAFVPQVWKIYSTKSAKDVSISMFLLFTLGVSLWLVYGFMNSVWPMIFANSITLVLAGMIIYFKFKYKE
ncbi:MAG: SemiSWEET transporter [Pseudarcicella sp.]|nr:SemiSWEET transporter [Pseudarcicella sp.]